MMLWRELTASLNAVARRVRGQLQRCPACGAYEFYQHVTLWDEFCHWIQSDPDPPPSRAAWEATIDPFIGFVVEKIGPTEARQLTEAAEWATGEFLEYPAHDTGDAPGTIDRALISRAVRLSLMELAEGRQADRLRSRYRVGNSDKY